MEFDVSIFDSSHCDREYADYMQIEQQEEQTSKKFEFNDKPNPCIMSSTKGFPNAKAATQSPLDQSHFVFTVKPYCLTNGYLRLPKQFAKKNCLINKNCDVIIRDERQRSWKVRLTAYGSQVYILGGWREFCVANGLKVGDHRMFEVVTNGENPIWKFQYDKPNPSIKSSRKAFPHAEVATHSHKPFGYSHFVCTIRPYCLSYDLLCIPSKFAHANRLMNKKYDLIIRDERQRSWCLRLCYFGTGVCIKGGWDEFRDTNCLKKGDCVMFEVVSDGEKPIWQFHGKTSVERMQASYKGLTEQ
ncbi:B3 domain-containing protein REM17-like [Lycium ferocissimum]|uniref:B3 domain-containing protein REM17-like n=1 Tax=Lycium ferocissimum TaxID=112874 RepID=UPI0028154A0F|nr:B3 domain-containing protein REM17-like [Lycium ferocissimum]